MGIGPDEENNRWARKERKRYLWVVEVDYPIATMISCTPHRMAILKAWGKYKGCEMETSGGSFWREDIFPYRVWHCLWTRMGLRWCSIKLSKLCKILHETYQLYILLSSYPIFLVKVILFYPSKFDISFPVNFHPLNWFFRSITICRDGKEDMARTWRRWITKSGMAVDEENQCKFKEMETKREWRAQDWKVSGERRLRSVDPKQLLNQLPTSTRTTINSFIA